MSTLQTFTAKAASPRGSAMRPIGVGRASGRASNPAGGYRHSLAVRQDPSMTDERLNLSFDAFQDAEAGIWVATSAQGRITTEAPSRDALIERLKVIVPDVLESRLGHPPHDVSI